MDTRLYWVFGNSVEHSLSPRVHYLFAKQHGIELNYNKYHVNEVLKLFRICRWFKKKSCVYYYNEKEAILSH